MGNRRILLRLDHQPAVIILRLQQPHNRRVIDAAVARHGKYAAQHRIEEAGFAVFDVRQHVGTHVFAVDVIDARRPALRHRQRIGPGKGQMAGIQQQSDRLPGVSHQIVHVLGRLNHRAHMVMVGNLHALLLRIAGKFGELLAVLLPAFLREARAQMHRGLLLAVGLHGGDLLLHAALQQAAGVPAGDQLQVVALQDGAKQARFAREFIAQLEAGKTGLFTFAQTALQRRLRAERRQIVVRPRQRINA
ncbi:hypothetical protein L1887_46540 [Cichorium endivia]|nr:hypothetical protein L1887_46540 [Cichorium endivia]